MSDQNEAPKSKLKLSSLSRKEDSGQPENVEKAPTTASVDRAEPAATKPRLAFSPKAKPSAEATPSSSPTAPAPAPSPATPEQPAEIKAEASTPAAPTPVAPAAPTPETETPAPAPRIAIKRKVDATPEAPAAETPAAPTSTPAVAEEKPKLGLKAKIEAAGTSSDAASTQSDATPDAPNPKFGLKTKPTESTPASATPPPLKTQPKTSTEVQKPTPKPATAATKNQPTPPELPTSKDTLNSTGTEAPTSSRSNVVTSVIIILVLFCILAAAAGGIWFVLKDMVEPQVTESSAEVTTPPATEPESSTDGFNLAAPINQAKESIAKVPVMDLEVIEGEKETLPPSEPIIVRPQPAAAPVPVSSEATATAATSYKEAVSNFLANAYIGGVRNGANAKVIIDGRSHTIGSVVDPKTGLTFLGTRDGRLVFRDGNSVVYVKSF